MNKLQQIIFNLLIIISFSLIKSDTVICGHGCIECDKNLKCLKCDDGFNYDSINNNCVYPSCEQSFFYQKRINQNDPKGFEKQCLVVCDDGYYQSQSQNSCVKFDQCSLSYESQKNINRGQMVADIIQYKYEYVIAIYQNYINQIVRANGKIEQTLDLSEEIIQIISLNQQIFILQSDFYFYLWDISYSNKIQITSIKQNVENIDEVNLLSINNSIIYFFIIKKNQNSIIIQQLYSIFPSSNQSDQIQIKKPYDNNDSLQIIDKFMLFYNNGLRIDEVVINDKQVIDIYEFTKSKYICPDFINSEVKMIQKSKSGKYIIFIFSQSKQMIQISQDDCLKFTFNYIPIKFESVTMKGQDYLVLQMQSQLVVFNVNLQSIEFSLDLLNPIIDINLSINNNNNEIQQSIFCLFNNQELIKYNLQISNNNLSLIKQKEEVIIINSPNKLFTLPEISLNNLGERIFVSGQDIQSLLNKNTEQNTDDNEKIQYIILNYELSYDSIPSPLVSSVLLEDQKTILACTSDSIIYSWDISLMYRESFQNKTKILNSSCLELKQFNNINQYDIIGIFSNQIIIFDAFNLEMKQSYKFQIDSQPIQPLITLYKNQAIMMFDQKIYYISQNDYTLKKLNFNNFTVDIAKIVIQQNNQLLIQKSLTVELYIFNLSTNELTYQTSYISKSSIQIWKIKEYPQSYSYQFEIYLYQSDNTFVFMKNDLIPYNTIIGVPLQQGLDITFIQNDYEDKTIFILGKTNKVGAILPYECYAVQSNKNNFVLFFSLNNAQSLIEPVKYLDSALAIVYDVKVTQNHSSFSTIASYSYNIGLGTSFYDEITILLGITGSKHLQTRNKDFNFVYDDKGFLGLNILKRQYYNMINSVSDQDIAKGDQITDVQQSYLLNKYFVIRRNIQVFDFQTFKFIEEITFELNESDPIKTFIILESQKIIIGCKKNIIKLKNYNTNLNYTYTDTITITNIQIVTINGLQYITVFGNKIFRLNFNLVNEEKTSLTLFKDTLASSCQFPKNLIICKLSTNIIQIINSQSLTISTQISTKSLSSSFLLSIDESFDRFFLYTDSVEVWSFKGVFQQKITQSSGSILDFKICGNNIILVTSGSNFYFSVKIFFFIFQSFKSMKDLKHFELKKNKLYIFHSGNLNKFLQLNFVLLSFTLLYILQQQDSIKEKQQQIIQIQNQNQKSEYFKRLNKTKFYYHQIFQFILLIYFNKYNNQDLVVLDRTSLVNRGSLQGAGGEEYNHILSCTDLYRFAQVYIFSLDTLLQVFSMKSQNTQNDVTGGIDMIFDKHMNILTYLDQTGNVYFIDYQGTYQQQNILKIREFHSGINPPPLGLRLNFQANQLSIFSKNRIYKSNYSQFSNSYKRYQMRLNTYFALVTRTNQITQQQEEVQIILGPSNTLYIYSEQKFSYFTHIINSEQIKDISYNTNLKLLLIAFESSFYIYDFSNILNNLEILIQKILPKKEQRYKFQSFLSQDIFLTSDLKIIHFNFQSQTQLQEISLNKYQRITSKNLINSLNFLVLGFNDGTVLIYDISNKKQYSFSLAINSNQNDIRFIQETESYIWISSLNCNVLQINKITIKEKKIDLNQFKEDSNSYLGQISVDEKYKKLFVSFFKEKIIRCLNLEDLSFLMYLSFPDNQYNRIMITPTQLIFYSTFQLNIHDRITLSYLTSIRRQNLQDQIMNFESFQDKYYCILSINKYEIFKIDSQYNIILLDQIVVQALKIIKIYLDNSNSILRVIGISKNQLFDQTYNLRSYELQKSLGLKQCSLEIKDQTYIEMQKSIHLIKPIKNQLPTLMSLVELPNSSQNIFYTVYVGNDDLKEVNSLATIDSQITIIPNTDISKRLTQIDILYVYPLKIYEYTFINIAKKEILIKDFNFIFQNKRQLIEMNAYTTKIYLQNISISNQKLTDFQFSIENKQSVIIMNLTIENLVLSYTDLNLSFLKFLNCQTIKIVKMKIKNVNIDSIINQFLEATESQDIVINQLEIIGSQLSSVLQLINVQNLVIQNVKINNCKILFTNYTESIDSLYIIKIQGTQNLSLTNITMSNNKNIKFLYSKNQVLKNFKEITLNTDKIFIEKAEFDENINDYSNNSQMIVLYSNNVEILSLKFQNNNQNIKFLNSQTIKISNSSFYNNTNVNGGALSFIRVKKQILIIKTEFYVNQAFGSGGAIYCNELIGNISIDSESSINNNKALIGGGIRIYNTENEIMDQKIKDMLKNVQISNNFAELYGQQYASFLQNLQITSLLSDTEFYQSQQEFQYKKESELNETEQNLYSGKLIIKNIRSGSDLKITFFVMDSNGDYIRFSLDKLKKGEYPTEIQQELLSFYFQIDSQNKKYVLLNGETLITSDSYNSSINQFSFREVQISSYPQKQFDIQLNYMINYKKLKPILIDIQFRNCQIGEMIKFLSENIINCQFCPEGSYSYQEPSLSSYQSSDSNQKISNQMIEENSLCQKCPDSAEKCQGYEIYLKNGYWRTNKNSSEIIFCSNNPSNCNSQDLESIDGCIEGTLGPLCEECDTLGMKWLGKIFAKTFKSQYQCSECSSNVLQITYIIILSGFLILYSLMSTFIFIGSFRYIQTCYYLRMLSIFPVSYSSMRDQSSFYLKILVNYFQLSSLLIYFKIQILPEIVQQIFSIISTPAYKVTVTADCLISQLVHTRFQRIIAIQLAFVFFPLIYLIVLVIIFKVLEQFKKSSVKKSHIYTLVNFMFVFFQPSQINFFTSSLSCREIGQNKYVEVDLLIECLDSKYELFSIPFSIIFLIFWTFCPIIIFINIRKQQNKLDYCKNRYKYGYYYSEFKKKYYFWEFIRMYIRLGVVMIFTLMKQNIFLAHLIIIFIFSLYIKFVLIFNPFQNRKLQQFEIMSNQALIVFIILTSVSTSFPNYALLVLFEVAHVIIIFYIIFVIISYKASSELNIFGKIVRWILQKILSTKKFERYLQKQTISFISFIRWKIIKNNLSTIISCNAIKKAQKISNSFNKNEDLQQKVNQYVQDISMQASQTKDYSNSKIFAKQGSLISNIEDIPSQIQQNHQDKSPNNQENKQDLQMATSKFSDFSEIQFPQEKEDFEIQRFETITQQQNPNSGSPSPYLQPSNYDFQFLYKQKFQDNNYAKKSINNQEI